MFNIPQILQEARCKYAQMNICALAYKLTGNAPKWKETQDKLRLLEIIIFALEDVECLSEEKVIKIVDNYKGLVGCCGCRGEKIPDEVTSYYFLNPEEYPQEGAIIPPLPIGDYSPIDYNSTDYNT